MHDNLLGWGDQEGSLLFAERHNGTQTGSILNRLLLAKDTICIILWTYVLWTGLGLKAVHREQCTPVYNKSKMNIYAMKLLSLLISCPVSSFF